MKNYIILFFSIVFEIIGWYSLYKYIFKSNDDVSTGILFLPLSIVMLFYLWKNNFFTTNKFCSDK
ncbi:MAG: hypothetical protein CMC82_03970 [Flavobacteriaceae bacterium]|nr:hypothetical protein [Flavobacteriaceae bacterium]|tara:strand:- start:110 stop:304 length:195 start_codon:yes stop_codon:yes gene_type:complete